MFEPLPRQSLSGSVFEQLRDQIVGRQLSAGDALPSERMLAELLGVNRGAVREGIKRLQQAGLITVRHGGSTVVLDYLEEGGLELLPALLIDKNGRINPAAARSIMALRGRLAPSVAASAAARPNPKLADALELHLEALVKASERPADAQEAAMDYWSELVRGSGNLAFRLAFTSMSKTYRQIWPLLTEALAPEFGDHANLRALTRAVANGNPQAAREAAAAHVAIGEQAILQLMDRYEASQ